MWINNNSYPVYVSKAKSQNPIIGKKQYIASMFAQNDPDILMTSFRRWPEYPDDHPEYPADIVWEYYSNTLDHFCFYF